MFTVFTLPEMFYSLKFGLFRFERGVHRYSAHFWLQRVNFFDHHNFIMCLLFHNEILMRLHQSLNGRLNRIFKNEQLLSSILYPLSQQWATSWGGKSLTAANVVQIFLWNGLIFGIYLPFSIVEACICLVLPTYPPNSIGFLQKAPEGRNCRTSARLCRFKL